VNSGKRNKENVGYDNYSGHSARRCGTCIHFEYPDICDAVAGMVDPDGICDLYDIDSSKKAYAMLAGFKDKLTEK
jgi:hypothetical protein